jgi:hypothetical protein
LNDHLEFGRDNGEMEASVQIGSQNTSVLVTAYKR